MQVLTRALECLRLLAVRQQGATLSEISMELGIPPSSAHRLLSALERERLLSKSSRSLRYFLGPASSKIAAEAAWRPLSLPHPAVVELAARIGERVLVTELFEDRAVCTDVVRPPAVSEGELFARPGQNMPLHACASARILLAYQDEESVAHWLRRRPLIRFTAATPRTAEAALRLIAAARQRGYDTCAGELQSDVWAVALPVRSAAGQVCAALTVAARNRDGADRRRRDALRRMLEETVSEISAGG